MKREDWISIAKGAGLAIAGALLTFTAAVLIPAMEASGNAGLLALAAFASVAINVLRKLMLPSE
jgi:hypothetical protein